MQKIPQGSSNLIVSLYFIMKMLPMLISGGCIYLGYDLFIQGVTGNASLSVESDTVSGQLINAAPGLFFALSGIIGLIFSIVKGVKMDFDNGKGERVFVRNIQRG